MHVEDRRRLFDNVFLGFFRLAHFVLSLPWEREYTKWYYHVKLFFEYGNGRL